jgi:hypothetical protein
MQEYSCSSSARASECKDPSERQNESPAWHNTACSAVPCRLSAGRVERQRRRRSGLLLQGTLGTLFLDGVLSASPSASSSVL